MAQAKARDLFRDADQEVDGWVGQWRRCARHLSQLSADPEELRLAEQALAQDMSEENLRRLQAILDRMRRDALESGAA
jgi:DNA primase